MYNSHNCGRLPWNVLDSSIIKHFDGNLYSLRVVNEKAIDYFSHEFVRTIQEFADSDKSEIEDEFNPCKWKFHVDFYGAGGQIGYIPTLICVYIMLNLILIDYKKYNTKFSSRSKYYHKPYGKPEYPWSFNCARGSADIGLNESLETMFDRILFFIYDRETNELKQISKDDVQQIRDYLSIIFKCLYTIHRQRPNLISPSIVSCRIDWFLSVGNF